MLAPPHAPRTPDRPSLLRAARRSETAAVLAWILAALLAVLGVGGMVFMLPAHPERWQGTATLVVAAGVTAALARSQQRAARRLRHAARAAQQEESA